MDMEDDKIKDIFKDFNPELSPDNQFLQRLERNIEIAEEIKRQNAAFHKNSRRAVVYAALAGFVTGALLMLLLPTATSIITVFNAGAGQTHNNILSALEHSLPLLFIAGASVLTAYNAYVILLSKMKHRS